MTPIAILIASNMASGATDRRADAYLFDMQTDILRSGFAPSGLSVETVRWVDLGVDWKRFGAVLVFAAWDYQDDHTAFLDRIDSLVAQGVSVFNPPGLVRWNIRKTYLRDMEKRGVPIIPTLWPEHPTAQDIEDAFDVFGTGDVILKRQVGAGARAQARFSKHDLPPPGPLLDRPGMIQPFVPTIVTEGEFSFLFIDGEFSHALVKRAADGDYRIQEAYGGKSGRTDPSAVDRKQARAVLDALDETPLYARVDMVRGLDGSLLLMELEVIEPYLFPLEGEHIGAMLGRALKKRIG